MASKNNVSTFPASRWQRGHIIFQVIIQVNSDMPKVHQALNFKRLKKKNSDSSLYDLFIVNTVLDS